MNLRVQFIVYDRAREQGRIQWHGERLVIGRRSDADIRVNEPTMSGMHAELVPAASGLMVRDLSSLNGTLLNGARVIESKLVPGDTIQIGRARIRVETLEPRNMLSSGGFARRPESLEGRLPAPADGREPTREQLPETVRMVSSASELPQDFNSSQTVKISLDQLRSSHHEEIPEDERILLLRNLFESLGGVEDSETILETTRRVLERAFARSRAFILVERDGHWRDWRRPDRRQESGPLRPSMTFVEETVNTMSAILSTSLPEDRRFSASESARISGIETAMAAPTHCDGKPTAVLYVDRLGLPPFSLQDLNILGIAANHVSAVLENGSRIADLRRTNRELLEARETLAEMNRNLEQLVEERTAEIRRQNQEIQRLADAKDELMGIAAHDIRGPLTVVQGTAELLRIRMRMGQLEEDTLHTSLDMIHGAARGLSQLLSELLDAKAIESGKIRLRRRRATVDELFEVALPVPRLAAEDKGIALVTEADEGAASWADPQRLGQAITNLMLNAVKFSESGSRILLRGTVADDGRIEISVEDQGPGIPESELGDIFGTFEQGEAGRRHGGSGLGLMIAKRLVDLHDGELTVESELGVGSRFVMHLPAYREGQSESVQAPGGEDDDTTLAESATDPDLLALDAEVGAA